MDKGKIKIVKLKKGLYKKALFSIRFCSLRMRKKYLEQR